MTIRGTKKIKAKKIQVTFYPDPPALRPEHVQPQPEAPAAPLPPPGLQEQVADLIQHTVEEIMQHVMEKGEETQELLERMVAHHSQRLEALVVEQVTRTEHKMEGELRELSRRLKCLKGRQQPRGGTWSY